MSSLFNKVSWPANVEKFNSLRQEAKRAGFKLWVKNRNTRRVPIFLFYLKRGNDQFEWFHSLSDVAARLADVNAVGEQG